MKTLEGQFLQNLHCSGLGYEGMQMDTSLDYRGSEFSDVTFFVVVLYSCGITVT
jgi:hypothetical protein